MEKPLNLRTSSPTRYAHEHNTVPTYPASRDAQDFRWSSWASPDAGWALNDRLTDRRCVGSWAYRVGLMQRAKPRCLLLFSYLLPLVRTSLLMNNTNALR